MIEITVAADGKAPAKHRFEGDRVRIGRGDDNDLVLDSRGCSRHHAEIVREAAGYRLVDLGSTNGVLFGSRVVRELTLADGLEVTIGEHRLTFALPAQPAAEATVLMSFDGSVGGAPPAPPAGPPTLYLVTGSGQDERYLKIVPGTEYVLGRSPGADLVLDDRESSKQHALVCVRQGRFHVVDLESSNGTSVNGERIREAPLAPGDEITIGHTSIRVQDQILDIVDRAQLIERTHLGAPRWSEPQPSIAPDVLQGTDRRFGSSRPLFVALGVAVLLAVAAAAFFWGRRAATPAVSESAGERPAAQETAPRLVQVVPVESKEQVLDLSGSGSVEARRSVTVSAEVAARVEEVPVEEGATVERATLLVRLDDHDVRHRIEAARASISEEQLSLAREDYERKERLFNEGAVVRSVYEEAKNRYLTLDSTFRSIQATITRLEDQLTKTRVTAPISGVVTRIAVEAGEVVGAGSPLATVEDMDEVVVQLELADRDFVQVSPGQPVEATAGAFPGQVFHGEVARLGSAANPATRTFEVEARLDNADLRLRPGLIVSLRIVLGRERGLTVPAEAIVDEQDDRGAVFVARAGVARRVDVVLGRRVDREVQVKEGLSEGDEVVVVGHERLADGQPVETYRQQ